MPTPSARLSQISAGSDGEVWGVNGGVYRFTGATWYQPNPEARLGQISVAGKDLIWGTTSGAVVFSRELVNTQSLYGFYAIYR